MMKYTFSRRDFLSHITRGAVLTGLTPPFLAHRAFAQSKRSPNDRIQLGFIGIGGMGGGHLHNSINNPDCQVVAVCDVYEEHRNQAKARVDDKYENNDCAAYRDFRKMLERNDIDGVIIATPDHWHTRTSLTALETGRDVYCEKPLTLTIDEGKKLVEAVRRYGRVFQTGSMQRSGPEFRFGCELVRNGAIGEVHTVLVGLFGARHNIQDPDTDPPPGLDWDLYLGPAPKVPFNKARFLGHFRLFWDYSGGMMTDWGAHHLDIAQWGLGMDESGPVAVEGTGEYNPEGISEIFAEFEVRYEYANGVKMIAASTGRPILGRSKRPGGTYFEGTKGWVHVDRGFIDAGPKELLETQFGPNDIRLYNNPGMLYHQQDWMNCMRTRRRPICDVEIGHRSATICHIGNIAIRIGRRLQWDPVKQEFINDPEANRWLSRPYRAPWVL